MTDNEFSCNFMPDRFQATLFLLANASLKNALRRAKSLLTLIMLISKPIFTQIKKQKLQQDINEYSLYFKWLLAKEGVLCLSGVKDLRAARN
jgi:hypothetical protein